MAIKKDIHLTNPLEKYLDRFTHYQLWVFFLIFISKIPIFWHIINLIFLSPPMSFTCIDEMVINSYGVSSEKLENLCPCEYVRWNRSIFTKTMQTKYNLRCDRSWVTHFAHSMFYLGALCGCLFFGFLSDRYGRLFIFTSAIFITATAGSLLTVMPTHGLFIFIRFLEGLGVGGCIVTSYVLCIEYCGTKHREVVTSLFHIPLNVAHITIPGISYLLRDMEQFQLTLSAPLFIFVSLYWLIHESPKWLMDNGHIDKLAKSLERISPLTIAETEEEVLEFLESRGRSNSREIKFWHIFTHKKLTINFLCMGVIYFVCGMGYYGVSQFIGAMAGDIFTNVSISGLCLLPGTILCTILMLLVPRKMLLMSTCFLSGIFMVAVICTPVHIVWLRITFACAANCFFFMAFIVVFLYAVELFPTSVRNSVLGVLSMLARIGQIIDPPINSLSELTAGIIFAVMAITGGLMCVPLPETSNVELPSSLEDSEAIK